MFPTSYSRRDQKLFLRCYQTWLYDILNYLYIRTYITTVWVFRVTMQTCFGLGQWQPLEPQLEHFGALLWQEMGQESATVARGTMSALLGVELDAKISRARFLKLIGGEERIHGQRTSMDVDGLGHFHAIMEIVTYIIHIIIFKSWWFEHLKKVLPFGLRRRNTALRCCGRLCWT